MDIKPVVLLPLQCTTEALVALREVIGDAIEAGDDFAQFRARVNRALAAETQAAECAYEAGQNSPVRRYVTPGLMAEALRRKQATSIRQPSELQEETPFLQSHSQPLKDGV